MTLIVSYGGGTNSTALIVELIRRGEPIGAITFADTGSERPYTYAYVAYFSRWLTAQGRPPITILRQAASTRRLRPNA